MKTTIADPWSNGLDASGDFEINGNNAARFEDSFVSEPLEPSRLLDSEQYLARLYARLKNVKGGTSKKDLINSLSNVKEDCIARLISNGQSFESEEEAMLAANPVIRHIAPHLQALTASELVHLLKADVLQTVTNEQNGHEKSRIENGQLEIENPSTKSEMTTAETEQTLNDNLQTEQIEAKRLDTEPIDSEQSETEIAHSSTDLERDHVERNIDVQ